MNNCIFTAHCTEPFCDASCPAYVETSYLLERNNLNIYNPVFNSSDPDNITKVCNNLDKYTGKVAVIRSTNTVTDSNLYTYCAICKNWRGNCLHCTVYNLRFSNLLEETKQSWTTHKEPDSLQYMNIWSKTSKILIISNLDFVNFNDFESQMLLNLIQSRQNTGKTTLIISPPVNKLVGKGQFFTRLCEVLGNIGGSDR